MTLPEADDTINVLIVKEPSISQAFVNSQISILTNVWNNTDFVNGSAPVSLTVINSGAALSTLTDLTGSNADKIVQVKIFVSTELAGLPSIRDTLAADVVIAFVDDLNGACGKAPQDNWLGPAADFVEDIVLTPGLDLRGSDHDALFDGGYYVAMVTNDGACSAAWNLDLAAHELGHLFGAGHFEAPGPFARTGLFDNSLPLIDPHFEFIPCCFSFTINYRTVMGSDLDSECTGGCALLSRYSDRFYGNFSRMNTDAIDTTAVSVAQYRAGPGIQGLVEQCFDGIDNDGDGETDSADGDCVTLSETPPPPPPPPTCDSTAMPHSLSGHLMAACAPNPSSGTPSLYHARWKHHCPGQVAFYEILRSVPAGAPYQVGWIRLVPETPIYVDATDGRLKVRSCGLAGCSLPTSNHFYAIDIC